MTSITTNVRENVMLFDFYLTHESESLSYTGVREFILYRLRSFVETGKNAEYSIWGARLDFSYPGNIKTKVRISIHE